MKKPYEKLEIIVKNRFLLLSDILTQSPETENDNDVGMDDLA